MSPIIHIETTSAHGFKRQQWTCATIRSRRSDKRPDRDYVVVGTWDLYNAPDDVALYISPKGLEGEPHSDYFGAAPIARSEIDEFESVGPEVRVRIIENAILRVIAAIENRIPGEISDRIQERELLLDAGCGDGDEAKTLTGIVKRALRKRGLPFDSATLSAAGARRYMKYFA